MRREEKSVEICCIRADSYRYPCSISWSVSSHEIPNAIVSSLINSETETTCMSFFNGYPLLTGAVINVLTGFISSIAVYVPRFNDGAIVALHSTAIVLFPSEITRSISAPWLVL